MSEIQSGRSSAATVKFRRDLISRFRVTFSLIDLPNYAPIDQSVMLPIALSAYVECKVRPILRTSRTCIRI